jgi:hypothetical protein
MDQRSDAVSGRMDEVLGGWDDLASGGFDAAGTLGHVSSVVRNLMLRVELFPPYRHPCVV